MARARLREMTAYGRLLIVTIAWGTLAFGAVYPWAYWPLAIASIGLGLWGISLGGTWADPRTRHLSLALGAIAAAVFIQIIDVPYSWLATLSPAVGRFLSEFQIGYLPAGSHALSLDPATTAVAFGLFSAFASDPTGGLWTYLTT